MRPVLTAYSNGQLRETLTSGIEQEEFRSRLCSALSEENIEHPPPHAPVPSSAAHVNSSTIPSPAPVLAASSRPVAQAPRSQLAPPSPTLSSSTSAATTQELRKERELATKAKGKQRAEPAPQTPVPAKDNSRAEWLAQQRQRQTQNRTEQERILAVIELDKAERKARQAEEKRLRLNQTAESEPTSNTQTSRTTRSSNAKTANLQVRLLDGGTVRNSFPADATLTNDIRPWIDSNLDSKAPYIFKHILPPHPARAISMSEENSTLRDLDLLPSATLVLQPISNYTEAYSRGPDGMLAMPYNAALSAYGLVTGTVKAVTGTLGGAASWLRGGTFTEQTIENHDAGGQVLGQAGDEIGRQQSQGGTVSAPSSARIRTLADQRAEREGQEFYNGNSLDTQPKNDDDADKEK